MTTPIPTPDVRYAGFWIRFLAFIVDSIAISLVFGPIAAAVVEKPDATAALLAAANSGDLIRIAQAIVDAVRPAGFADVLVNLVLPAAAVVLFWVYRSATPGKMVTNTRIVDATTGAAPTTRQAVIRYLGYFVSIFGAMLGFVWIAFDKRKQGWHDKLANTVVIRGGG